MKKLLGFILAITISFSVFSDTVRDGRYIVRLEDGTFISQHNEFHTANDAARHWSQTHDGEVVYIDPPAFRVTEDPTTEPPIIIDPPTPVGDWLAPEPDVDAILLPSGSSTDDIMDALNSRNDVLFEAGSSYELQFPQLRGGTEGDPRLIGVYGVGERPTFTVSSTWLYIKPESNVSHLVLSGLHLVNKGRVPDSPDFQINAKSTIGIYWLGGGGDILFEDLQIEGFQFGISINPQNDKTIEGLTLNRCIINDNWASGTDSSGALLKAVRNGVITNCLFYENGWIDGRVARTFRSHNVYISPRPNDLSDTRAFPWIIQFNVFYGGSSHGAKIGTGGTVENNFWVENAIAFYVSRNDSVIRRNVILNAQDLDNLSPNERGYGFECFSLSNVTVIDNIVANQQSFRPEASASYAIKFSGASNFVSNGNRVYFQEQKSGSGEGITYRSELFEYDSVDVYGMIEDLLARNRGDWTTIIEDNIEEFHELPE